MCINKYIGDNNNFIYKQKCDLCFVCVAMGVK